MLRLGGWLVSCIFSIKILLSVILRFSVEGTATRFFAVCTVSYLEHDIRAPKLVRLLGLDSFSPDDVRGAEPGRVQTSFSAVRGDAPSLLEDSTVKAMANAMDGVVHNG
jgi:hypothetical protein